MGLAKKDWFVKQIKEQCDETRCEIEQGKESGKWASKRVRELRGKIVFFPKDKKEDEARKTQETKGENLQGMSPKNLFKFGTKGGTSVAKSLDKYFKKACQKQKSRKKGSKKAFMFYLSGTGSLPGFGPICMATGEGCKENKKKNKQILGLNNMMMNKLNEGVYSEVGFGLVMMDFPGPLLVKKIIEVNPDATRQKKEWSF